jgi:hypothetical protein
MKLWVAWLAAFSAAFNVAFFSLILWGQIGITGALELAIGPMGLAAVIATPLVARRNDRRWWLWLLMSVGLPFVPLIALTLAGMQGDRRFPCLACKGTISRGDAYCLHCGASTGSGRPQA